MDTNDEKSLSEKLEEISKVFNETFDQVEKEQEQYWNSLTKDQQLMVFCAVCRRLVEGELEVRGSYRYNLYQVFGFGPEAYVPAQIAGYLALHNSIHHASHDSDLLTAFCKENKIKSYKEKIRNFLT